MQIYVKSPRSSLLGNEGFFMEMYRATALLKEWVVRMDELKSGEITRDEYFEWKINWPQTYDGCGKYEPKKQLRSAKSKLSET